MGFEKMNKDKLRQISAMGGKAVGSSNRSFAYDPEHAREAGRAGGKVQSPKRFRFNSEQARAAALKGVELRRQKKEAEAKKMEDTNGLGET